MATETRKAVREELSGMITKCKRISVNGVSYFGEIIINENNSRTVKNAVEEGSSMRETVRSWVKNYNLGTLQQLEISGDATYVVKGVTEDQLQEAEMIIIEAARAAANAIPELINSKF